MQGVEVLTGADIGRAVTRMAHEVVERNHGARNLVVMGIPSRGAPLAERLAGAIGRIEQDFAPDAALGQLDITMYRDDLRAKPTLQPRPVKLPAAGIDGKVVVLVDDVLYSGRTVRAALDALADLGRPKAVQLAVLVDRGHRELPIRADFVGKNLPTSASERVTVSLAETDGQDRVVIEEGR